MQKTAHARRDEVKTVNILSLDIGTTSMRGILFDQQGHMLCTNSVQTVLITDGTHNYIEQSPEVFLWGIEEICRRTTKENRVDALSITAFRSAPTLVDRNGRALCNFIMWQDTRNQEIVDRLSCWNEEIYARCGATSNTVFTGPKLMWMKENNSGIYKRAYKAMVVPDYIIHHMTGAFVTDRTYGSRTLLMDINMLEWSASMFDRMGLDQDKMCDLVEQGSIVGYVTRDFARSTGLKAGIPVISAGGDQQCAALGLGVTDSSTIEVNSGTGAFVISLTQSPDLTNSNVICNVAAIPGMYTLEMNVIASASSMNWLIREFFPEYWSGEVDFDKINRIAEETPAGSNGLYALAHFQGCGTRDWNPAARACFYGFSLTSRRRDMIRALYEGIASEVAKSIDVLPEKCRKAQHIAVAGGMSKSDVYNQILCDMTNRSILRDNNTQATAWGAYISATVALGIYPDFETAIRHLRSERAEHVYTPDPVNVQLYQIYKERTEKLYHTIK